jgi:hypothetical protein
MCEKGVSTRTRFAALKPADVIHGKSLTGMNDILDWMEHRNPVSRSACASYQDLREGREYYLWLSSWLRKNVGSRVTGHGSFPRKREVGWQRLLKKEKMPVSMAFGVSHHSLVVYHTVISSIETRTPTHLLKQSTVKFPAPC